MLSKKSSGQFIDFAVPTSLSEGEARERLIREGWTADSSEGDRLKRGSRLWMRMWGGHLVRFENWPMIAEVMRVESGVVVRVRDNFGRVWAWSVPDEEGQVAGGAAGRVASGVDLADKGAAQMEKQLTILLSN